MSLAVPTVAQLKLAAVVERDGAVTVAKRTRTMPNTIRLLAAGASDPHRSTIEKLAVLGIASSDWFTPAQSEATVVKDSAPTGASL